MGRNRFVDPGVTKLDLSDGDWIEVRDQLPFGLKQKLDSAAIGGLQGFGDGDLSGATLSIDMGAYEIERILAWVVDWSFRDGQDKPVALTRAAVERLRDEDAGEIRAALDAHVGRIEAGKDPATRTSAARASSP